MRFGPLPRTAAFGGDGVRRYDARGVTLRFDQAFARVRAFAPPSLRPEALRPVSELLVQL